ncbi:hypothetical protein ABT299_10710 [Spirillospora sp. NPDC000708]|jgi:hypothetical protein|uniref:hypothetical protein n=1 Tax=Actinomadura sp. RB99 TaxID=2691577 RepID=UPI001686007E|nr:hypothetical protein [Actinomadura sp. RB99]MBD2891150.1 hypothetical protein [Actinomadura sp. RB99]
MVATSPDLTGTGALSPALLRHLSALLLFGVGAVHLYEYMADYYRVIPIIGPLFAANFASAVVLGISLLVPLASIPLVRSLPLIGRAPHALVALGGIVFLLGTIIGLLISEQATLFGFHEYGYRTTVWLALGLESAAVLTLAGYLALETRRIRHRPAGAR